VIYEFVYKWIIYNNPNQKIHYVYVLKSMTTNKTYVGYSVDPYKRLRKHNGKLKEGLNILHLGYLEDNMLYLWIFW
jgi:hypothetical protein